MERLKLWKEQIPAWDEDAACAARARWDAVAKPLGSLGKLEKMTANIAGMQADADVTISPARLYVFCADNGIVSEGVTQTDASVTAAVARSMASGDYVLGLEPTNCYIMGRHDERENGTLPVLKAFETEKHTVTISFEEEKNNG